MAMNNQPSTMTNKNQLIPMGGAHYILANRNNTTFNKAVLNLWVWTGDYRVRTNTDPDYTFVKEMVSVTDYNISFEVAEYIRPHLNPKIDGNTYSGEACWFYYEITYVNNNVEVITTYSKLYLATLGYNYNYEGQSPLNGSKMPDGTTILTFDDNINNAQQYYSHVGEHSYKVANTLNIVSETSDNVIVRTPFFPTSLTCAKDAYIIYFINKKGIFEELTTLGKVTISNTIEKESYRKTYKDVSVFKSNVNHQRTEYNKVIYTNYNINTGNMHPFLAYKIEELSYSPAIYIKSVNTKKITAVTFESSNLERKTKINDKAKIVYNLQFKDTSTLIRTTI